ncbi:MAG: PQQ-binding-like beta-propeller repeat protein [Verrucomicrobiales bacterium]|nr:PQQ-binding-like beta-propeller repeat protein [Verrucomicrobiales bacterium]
MLRFIFVSLLFSSAAFADWNQWRGPDGQGHADTALPVKWSETENVTWKTALSGKGWSSPVIEGDQIWMTAAHETLATPEETAKRLETNTGSQPLVVLSMVRLHAICVDKNSGKLLHDFEILSRKEPQWAHKLNSYASPTPVIENGKLYCHFGSYGTACVDTQTVEVVWQNQDLYVHHENGPGSSPVLWRDHLIFHMDGSDKQYIVALDKHTGKIAWKTDRSGEMNSNPQLKKSYGTPLILDVGGEPVLFSPGADWLYAYQPDSGNELWKLNYGKLGFSIAPRPVAGHGMLYMSTSFMRPQLLAIKYSGSSPEIVWKSEKSVPNQPSPILVGDEVYYITDSGGIISCHDARTGELHWKERIGGNYSASPLHADGKIYFHSREGETTVIQAGKEFKILAKNTLDGAHMSSAAVDGGAIILRTDKAVYRIE